MLIQNTLLIIAAVALFAVPHSLLASLKLKQRLAQQFGMRLVEGWYRLFYNAFAAVTLLPVVVLLALLPDFEVYRAAPPWTYVMIALQVVGLLGLLWSVAAIDGMRFIGLKQALAFLEGKPLPLPDEPLTLNGIYGFVRHPLYLFSLMLLWFIPVMTFNTLLFNIGATLYFIFGSIAEESRMVKAFGDAYRAYQARVPWLIPFVPPRLLRG